MSLSNYKLLNLIIIQISNYLSFSYYFIIDKLLCSNKILNDINYLYKY